MVKDQKEAVKSQWKDYPNVTEAFVEAWEKLKEDENGYIDPYGGFSALDNGFQFKLDRDYLSPIPTTELTLNPKLKQNPGW